MNRQQLIWIPVIALGSLLVAGCSQDEENAGRGNSLCVPLTISSAGLQSEATHTRSYSPLTEGSIGVFRDNADGVTAYTPQKNLRYNYVDASSPWIAASELVYLKDEDAAVCAYYPYDKDVNDSHAVPLTVQMVSDDEIPLAYATNMTANTAADKQNVSFAMKQAYAWVVVNFTRSGSVKEDITLSEISVAGNQLPQHATLDIATGTQVNTTLTDSPISLKVDIPLVKGTTVTRNILMPPATSGSGLTIGVKIKEFADQMMSVQLSSFTNLQRGYKYVVTLTVNGTDIEVNSVQVVPWTERSLGSAGSPLVPMA